MKLSEMFAQVNAPTPGQKTAAATVTPIHEAQRLAQKAASSTETSSASAQSAVEGVAKLAADVATAGQEALVKEAQLYGAAVYDGFVARAAQFNAAAEKLAAEQPNESFEKFAAENPDLIKEAFDLGHSKTMWQLEKLAEAAREKGFQLQAQAFHKEAQDCFVRGYAAGESLVLQAGNQG